MRTTSKSALHTVFCYGIEEATFYYSGSGVKILQMHFEYYQLNVQNIL